MTALPGADARDAAIEAATSGAGPWIDDALAAIAYVVSIRERFTTDAVWAVLDRAGVPSPAERRAMGGAMQRARALAWIAPTDEFRPSVRPVCHRQPCRVWRRRFPPR